jgi:hypothetical protein
MALSTCALERNGCGGPIGGSRGHDRRRPQSLPPLPWLIVMFSAPPRLISMEPVVGGVTHDTINARNRLERARTADRQKKEPKPLTPIILPGFRVTNFCFFCFSRRGSEKKHGLSGCKKKVPPNSIVWVSIRIVLDVRLDSLPLRLTPVGLSLPLGS